MTTVNKIMREHACKETGKEKFMFIVIREDIFITAMEIGVKFLRKLRIDSHQDPALLVLGMSQKALFILF